MRLFMALVLMAGFTGITVAAGEAVGTEDETTTELVSADGKGKPGSKKGKKGGKKKGGKKGGKKAPPKKTTEEE